jgi:hypothetical protein
MRRERLRPLASEEAQAEFYAVPHNALDNADHQLRIALTVDLARALGPLSSVADLSCGDAAIASALDTPARYLGDLAPGYPITGPIESAIQEIPYVNLFVCTETIEHMDDPDTALKAIREKITLLVLSTPVDCWHDSNAQHYWAWDREAVEAMAATAGFTTKMYIELDLTAFGPHHYCFGIWAMR